MKKCKYTKQVQLAIILCFFVIFVFFVSKGNPPNSPESILTQEQKTPKVLSYLHGNNTFRLMYEGNMKFSNLFQREGAQETETVIFSSPEKNKGFQIFIAEYENTAPLTIETIALQNKNLDIFDPGAIDVNGEQGVVFLSAEKGTPTNTREIWFTHQGKIYQVSTYPDYGEKVMEMLTSWVWLE